MLYSFAKIFLLYLIIQFITIASAFAQTSPVNDADVSYIYTALGGTGTYKIEGRRITILNLPFSWSQQEMTETQAGMKWLLPAVIGYDQVGGTDSLEDLFPKDLITLALLPGFEYQMPLSRQWTLKPSGNIGLGHDFVTHEVIYQAVIGVSMLGLFEMEDGYEIRWGNKLRLAGELQEKSNYKTSFGIVETGVDIRKTTGFKLFQRRVDIGGYYRFQHFISEWRITDSVEKHNDLANVHELGLSFGLKKPRKIIGIRFSRIHLGYKFGDEVRGIVLSGEFPF